jgi:hypothetical protein
MIQVERGGFPCSVSIGPMVYHRCVIVKIQHSAIADSNVEPSNDPLLALSYHPIKYFRLSPKMVSIKEVS